MADYRDLTPETVFDPLKASEIILIDVREPGEFANEAIHGALLHPLSTVEPKAIHGDGQRTIDFQCGSATRSKSAFETFMASTGLEACHLVGGLAVWKAANQPIIKINPTTRQVENHGKN